MRVLKAYVTIIDRFTEFWAVSHYISLSLLLTVGFANVVMRYLGRFTPINASDVQFADRVAMVSLLVDLLLWLCLHLEEQYQRARRLLVRPTGVRRKAWIDFIGHLIALIPFCIIGIAVTWNPFCSHGDCAPMEPGYMGTLGSQRTASCTIKTFIILAFVSLLLQATVEVIRLVAVLRDVDELKSSCARRASANSR